MAEPGTVEVPSTTPATETSPIVVTKTPSPQLTEAAIKKSQSLTQMLLDKARNTIKLLAKHQSETTGIDLTNVPRIEPGKGYFPPDTPDGAEKPTWLNAPPHQKLRGYPLPTAENPVRSNDFVKDKKPEPPPPAPTHLYGEVTTKQ